MAQALVIICSLVGSFVLVQYWLPPDSEITAMRSCGIGAWAFVRIVSIVSIAALGLGILNSVYLAPRSAAGLLALQNSLKSSQASFEVQPRVFYEDFKNYVLYIQDVRPAAGAALWHHVFLADLTQPGNPNITTADEAVVVEFEGFGSAQAILKEALNCLGLPGGFPRPPILELSDDGRERVKDTLRKLGKI